MQELPDFSVLLPQTLRMPYSLQKQSVVRILDLKIYFQHYVMPKTILKKLLKIWKWKPCFLSFIIVQVVSKISRAQSSVIFISYYVKKRNIDFLTCFLFFVFSLFLVLRDTVKFFIWSSKKLVIFICTFAWQK